MREWIELELEVLTPAFISGANQKAVDLRAASIRGLLRWWWRATVGNTFTSAEKLLQQESEIFGSAEKRLKSRIAVEVSIHQQKLMERAKRLPSSGMQFSYRIGATVGKADILPYLAYGPVRPLKRDEIRDGRALDPAFNDPEGKALKGPVPIRPALAPGSSFTVCLAWFPDALQQDQVRQLVRAACAWVTLGGIGARSRKGFGQLEKKDLDSSSRALRSKAEDWWREARSDWLRNGAEIQNSLPPFPQLAYRRIIMTRPLNQGWPYVLGCLGMFYKQTLVPELKKSGLPWLRGTASDRRASSILLGVLREDARNLRGVICILPCARNGNPPAQNELKAVKSFLEAMKNSSLDCTKWANPGR